MRLAFCRSACTVPRERGTHARPEPGRETNDMNKETAIHVKFWVKVAALVAVFTIAPAAAVIFTTTTDTTSVSAVAVESVRDVNKTAKTPVTYTYAGVERTELAAVSAIAGDQVQIDVDTETGLPHSNTSLWVVMIVAAFGLVPAAFFMFNAMDTRDEQLLALLRKSYATAGDYYRW